MGKLTLYKGDTKNEFPSANITNQLRAKVITRKPSI
jgi:hypothetical protein